MFSIPPAIPASISPAAICWAIVTTACAPEPQTRLTVIAGTATGKPAADRRLAAWVHPVSGLDDVAHHHRADGGRIEARAPERLAHHRGTELGGGLSLSEPLKAPIAVRTGLQMTIASWADAAMDVFLVVEGWGSRR